MENIMPASNMKRIYDINVTYVIGKIFDNNSIQFTNK